MTQLLSPAAARSGTGRVRAAWTKAAAQVVAFGRAIANRRLVSPLFELSDRELRDIGLTRDDLRAALRQPLSRDPSVVLMVRAVDRRSRIRLSAAPAAAVRKVSEPVE